MTTTNRIHDAIQQSIEQTETIHLVGLSEDERMALVVECDDDCDGENGSYWGDVDGSTWRIQVEQE